MKAKLLLLSLIVAVNGYAGSATWNLNPVSGDWNTAANWTPMTVPNGPDDIATLLASQNTDVFVSEDTELASWIFGLGASSYLVTIDGTILVTLSETGIANNSAADQTIFAKSDPSGVSGTAFFTNSASANGPLMFITEGSTAANFGNGGVVSFVDSSSVSQCTFLNHGATRDGIFGGRVALANNAQMFDCQATNEPGASPGANGGLTSFTDTASASNVTITSQGASVPGALGGMTTLIASATASDSVLTSNGAQIAGAGVGVTVIDNSVDVGNSTLIAASGINGGDGGLIRFSGFAQTDGARAELFGNGTLDVSDVLPRQAPTIIGSLEGDGLVIIGTIIGTETLSIGSNNLSTTFAGIIQEDPSVPGTGAISKVGTGTLTLTGANSYGAGTTVSGGVLIVSNVTGSGTGTGSVTVKTSTLGGSGIISGPVTVGTTNGTGSFLAPAFGSSTQATLTLQQSLTFKTDATYIYTFKANKNRARGDLVIANGVAINNATIAITGTIQRRMRRGMVLIVISNTSANPISGTFTNLAEGAIVTVNGNNLQASYSDGDGNDLTLTVVP